MGRLKKDHNGYATSGRWLKYQQPSVNERPIPTPKKKKNTKLWCKGKEGVRHIYVVVEKHKGFGWWINKVCASCKKKKTIWLH